MGNVPYFCRLALHTRFETVVRAPRLVWCCQRHHGKPHIQLFGRAVALLHRVGETHFSRFAAKNVPQILLGMPRSTIRSPDEPVNRDSGQLVWKCLQEGLIDETDVTASGHIRRDLSVELPAPSPTNWAAELQSTTPFGRQTRPNLFSTPERKKTPGPGAGTHAPSPIPPGAPVRRPVLANLTNVANKRGEEEDVHIRILKLELENSENETRLARNAALRAHATVQKFRNVVAQFDDLMSDA